MKVDVRSGCKRRVTIIQRVLPHYRVPFFSLLTEKLLEHDIALKIIYGQEYPGTVPMTHYVGEPWATQVRNKYIKIGNKELVWQPIISHVRGAELIVIEQSNRLLINHLFFIRRLFKKTSKLAYWGHGRNMQAINPNSISEKVKRALITRVDWWFVYTELGIEIVRDSRFPLENITIVENSIDTKELKSALSDVTEIDRVALRSQLGLKGDVVALYCGGMYAEKRLDFLLETCHVVRQKIPGFHMIFIGSGPEQWKIERAGQEYDWIHYVGPKYGQERAVYFKESKVLLMPGLVGLAIVDSFATATPLFTTDLPTHSPEIAYLNKGVNGVMTAPLVNDYADAVIKYLESEELLYSLEKACEQSAKKYTLENMVNNFALGIEACLSNN